MAFWNWSRVAANNATAMAGGWPEGMAPSQVNDSARLNGSELACYRDDIAGAIVTGGTSTAYTITSYEIFDTLAHMNGAMIAFSPHATNGATVTLNVDGLGAKPLRSAPSVELLAGTLILGTPYVATYNNSDAVWYLQNFFGNPYNVPIAGGMDFWGTSVPNSAFAFPIGQAISRATYSALFAIMSTTYGTGDGSTTFNLPDKTGRVSAMKEASATRLTTAVGGIDGATMGSAAGSQSHTLTTAEMPAHTHTITDPGHNHGSNANTSNSGATATAGGTTVTTPIAASINSNTTGITVNSAGTGNAHAIVQPTIICNYIIRII